MTSRIRAEKMLQLETVHLGSDVSKRKWVSRKNEMRKRRMFIKGCDNYCCGLLGLYPPGDPDKRCRTSLRRVPLMDKAIVTFTQQPLPGSQVHLLPHTYNLCLCWGWAAFWLHRKPWGIEAKRLRGTPYTLLTFCTRWFLLWSWPTSSNMASLHPLNTHSILLWQLKMILDIVKCPLGSSVTRVSK